jgi:hypothetical protein
MIGGRSQTACHQLIYGIQIGDYRMRRNWPGAPNDRNKSAISGQKELILLPKAPLFLVLMNGLYKVPDDAYSDDFHWIPINSEPSWLL